MPPNILVLNKSWVVTGAGDPEGTHAAPVGSLFMREDGAAGTCVYIKEVGTDAFGWKALRTPSYKEDPWTPVIYAAGGNTGVTYSVQQGRYIKTGRHVTVMYSVTLTSKGTLTGDLYMSLPIATSADSLATMWPVYFANFAVTATSVWAVTYGGFSASSVRFLARGGSFGATTSSEAAVTAVSILDTVTLQGAITYFSDM